MKKVIIIGCPGSGKSTFARKLSDVTRLPLYHLDMLYWNKDKTTVDKEVFDKRLISVMDKSGWIIDGDYASTMEMRLKECDTVFFLDYPQEVCIKGIEDRIGKSRPDMPWVESTVDEELVARAKSYNTESRPKVIALLEKYASKDIIVFRSREEAEEYLTIYRKSEEA